MQTWNPAAAFARLLPQDRLARNIGWYGIAEGAGRISRLVATVILARTMSAAELGTAATAITCFEIVRVLANNGLGQTIVRASESDLLAVGNSVHRLNWLFCVAMALIQLLSGAGIWYATGQNQVWGLVTCLAGVFLLMPFGLMHAYQHMRRNDIGHLARVATAQVVADNILTTLLAISGAGAWAIVLPKLLTAPIWVAGARWGSTWQPHLAAGYAPVKNILKFSFPLLCSEVLSAARTNGDKLLVGSMLGVEALGVYYFVFNAGIGFSLSLCTALSNSLFAELARFRSPARLNLRFDRAIWRTVMPISALICLQAAASFFYVPWVFGPKWAFAAPLVAALCFSAVSKPVYDASVQLLRASARTKLECLSSFVLTTCSFAVLIWLLPHGLEIAVIVMAATMFVLQIVLALWARYGTAAAQPPTRISDFDTIAQVNGVAA